MSYIHFGKDLMVNLSQTLNKEFIRTNREGGYGSTTLTGCNTSKYHGLLVVPQPAIDGDLHVLLSSLEDSLIQQDKEFQLAVHQYQNGVFYPKGHKYIQDLTSDPIPAITYRVGGALLKKERLNTFNGFRTMVRYTLLDAHTDTVLKIRPLMAYRNRHLLAHHNNDVDTNYEVIRNGIKCRMYTGYSYLNFQLNKNHEYLHAPDWYYNFEYEKDKNLGFDYIEDLYSPGYFLIPIKVGESVILSIGTEECNPSFLVRMFNQEITKRIPRDSFLGCLSNAAQQFIINSEKKYRVIAGYQWLGSIPRDTFISLPGLTLTQNRAEVFRSIIDNMVSDMRGPFFNFYDNIHSAPVPSADASLWFIWCLYEYAVNINGGKKYVWKRWGTTICKILESYKNGTDNEIYANEDGLLHQGRHGLALTWMNSVVNNKPVTPRTGYAVEINALWYNSIKIVVDLASNSNDMSIAQKWQEYADKVGESFVREFWCEEKGYLCDYFENYGNKNWLIRPNMLIAIGLHFSPLTDLMKSQIMQIVNDELFTPHGIRTLSPRHEEYCNVCSYNYNDIGMTLHQGSAFPWLMMFYAEAVLNILGEKNGIKKLKEIVKNFEDDLTENGVGTISQYYDGNPPYDGGGTISHATSVAALLKIANTIANYDKNNI